MVHSTQSRATVGRILALGLLLAALLVALVSTAPADAAVSSGKALAWGSNGEGQLGNNASGTNSSIPGLVPYLKGVKSVSAGCAHALALKTDGTVYAWGRNYNGQLGNGTTNRADVPTRVNISGVRAIAAGCTHSLALRNDGTVWAWGYNYFGQLGNGESGDGSDRNLPVRVANLDAGVKGLAAGRNFSLALMLDGTVRSWGENSYGQLGLGFYGPTTSERIPVAIPGFSGVRAIASDGEGKHSLALLSDGTVKSWGLNDQGQLGQGGNVGQVSARPFAVRDLKNVRAIATGEVHSLAVLESGRVKSWGNNTYGQLGNGAHGDGTGADTPVDVVGLSEVRSVTGGRYNSLAVLESGKVRSWGSNYSGELGNGTSGNGTESDVPVAVNNLTSVKRVAAGNGFALAVAD
jgi:alpha-tubulin suppressor-like RCC1 family protein